MSSPKSKKSSKKSSKKKSSEGQVADPVCFGSDAMLGSIETSIDVLTHRIVKEARTGKPENVAALAGALVNLVDIRKQLANQNIAKELLPYVPMIGEYLGEYIKGWFSDPEPESEEPRVN